MKKGEAGSKGKSGEGYVLSLPEARAASGDYYLVLSVALWIVKSPEERVIKGLMVGAFFPVPGF